MKQSLLLFVALCFSGALLNAQITVTNSIFPATGDVLKTRQATSISGVVVTSAGANQTWDFSSMVGGALDTASVVASSVGTYASLFANADIILETSILPGENYLEVTGDSMNIVGFAGDVLGIGVVVPAVFEDPFLLIKTPLTANSTFTDNSNFKVEIKANNYPALIAYLNDTLGLAAQGIVVDSLRILYNATTDYVVDAWGNLTVPEAGAFDVLRLKQVINANIAAEFKGTFANIPFNWTDPSNVPNFPPITFLGPSVNVNYFFYNNVEKETIAVIEMSPDDTSSISEVTYKSADATGVFGFAGFNLPSVKAYPNPAVSHLNLEFKNFETGNYEVKIYNIIGRELKSEEHYIDGMTTININTSNLPKGTYIYRVLDRSGNSILARRFMVARP